MSLGDPTPYFLTKKQILELCETEEGRTTVKNYIMRARIAYSVQAIFERLGAVPDASVQQDCCLLLETTLFRVPVENIFEWVDQVAKMYDERPDIFDNIPEC